MEKIGGGYEVIEWNETNCDLQCNSYIRKAVENKNWAFVSDYFRLRALYEFGGIYLDTDVEIYKSFDDLLSKKGFVGYMHDALIGTAVLGFEKKNLFMVFCADCGRPMEFERLPHGAEESKKVCYYICKARQADDKCIGHQITEKLLKALIMDQLHLFITQLSDRRKVVEELRKIEDVQNPVYRAKGEIMSLTDKVSQMAKKREQLYADYVAGVVDSEDYQLIREDYSRQYDGLRAALQEAENKKVQVEQQIEEYLNMTSHLEEHLDNFEFDIQLVKFLVQKIEVSADKRIRIVFGFRDVFTELGKESAET